MKRDWFRTFFDAEYLSLLLQQFDPKTTTQQVDFIEHCLQLRPGASILDVGCGYGRHALEFARRGYRVVGLDLCRAMIAEARRRSPRQSNLQYIRGDMRAIRSHCEFDAIICLFNTFGYFTNRENLRTLMRFARALQPGGWLFLEHRNPLYESRRAYTRDWTRFARGKFVLEERQWDSGRNLLESRWWIFQPRRGRMVGKTFRMRLYTVSEWRDMLRDCGFRLRAVYVDYQGTSYRKPDKGPLLIVGRKPDGTKE